MPELIGIALWALIPGFIAKKKGRSFWGYYFLSFLITPLITMIITACLKNISYETNHLNENSVIESTDISESATTTPVSLQSEQSLQDVFNEETVQAPETKKIQYCRRCGFRLIEGSEFCSNCGNKIESEVLEK